MSSTPPPKRRVNRALLITAIVVAGIALVQHFAAPDPAFQPPKALQAAQTPAAAASALRATQPSVNAPPPDLPASSTQNRTEDSVQTQLFQQIQALHPDVRDILSSQDFITWSQRPGYARQADVSQALTTGNAQDLSALLSQYKRETGQGVQPPQPAPAAMPFNPAEPPAEPPTMAAPAAAPWGNQPGR